LRDRYKGISIVLSLFLLTVLVTKAQDATPTHSIEIRFDARGIPMVYVPQGSLDMGISADEAISLCQKLAIAEGFPPCDEEFINNARQDPILTEVEAFYIDQYEVSRSAYIACVDVDVCEYEPLMYQPSEPLDVPIQNATYYDAAVYCAWREARLPIEAEWEYAARGQEGLTFPWGEVFDGSLTNHCDVNCLVLGDAASQSIWNDGYSELAPVDAFPDNQSWVGAQNLAGNILEWTSTRSSLNESPTDDLRVIKGGSLDAYPYQTAGWFIGAYNASFGRANIGFRCVRTTEP
jgi:formylglycine-generating enzyme required for sulfatase activity